VLTHSFLLLLGIVVGRTYCSQHILSHNDLYLENDIASWNGMMRNEGSCFF
jgi:hypothetical protein